MYEYYELMHMVFYPITMETDNIISGIESHGTRELYHKRTFLGLSANSPLALYYIMAAALGSAIDRLSTMFSTL